MKYLMKLCLVTCMVILANIFVVNIEASAGDNSCMYANDGECDYASGYCDLGTDENDCSSGANGPNSCMYANDGECDDGSVTPHHTSLCPPGTDANDCSGSSSGSAASLNSTLNISNDDSCRYANDDECDDDRYIGGIGSCPHGTDNSDCTRGTSGTVQNGANSCYYANDGECDEPNICTRGTDTNDCNGRNPRSEASVNIDNSCRYANDGECDEPDLCVDGTDTNDCSWERAHPNAGDNSCRYAFDNDCDEPDLCMVGTDSSDCGHPFR